jgi:thiamine-monophosphate kinase
MAALSERQLVRRLSERFGSRAPGIQLGIGDDAAVLSASAAAPPGASWVASVDASVQGVHFDLRYATLEDVGYRAFQAAASDLAAMGAAPVGALSALVLPRGMSSVAIDALTVGQQTASVECACPIIGGNISRGGELSITTTVLGRADRPLSRTGARPGEQVWLIGALGLAGAGFACLRVGSTGDALGGCVQAWRRPRALLEAGLSLVGRASAAIDVSDGLAADASQLARASGVQIVIERDLLRATFDSRLIGASRILRRSPMHFALLGGEDYALLATGPALKRPLGAVAIGHVRRGQGAVIATGAHRAPLRGGYDHLKRTR